MVDIVLVTLPKMEIRAPLIGPAALKSICQKNGYTVKTIDFNIDLYTRLRTQVPHWWIQNDWTFMDDQLFDDAWNTHIRDIAQQWVDQIAELNPKYVGITILSNWTERIATKFIDMLHKLRVKIVIGGPGVMPYYGPDMMQQNKIDAFIQGEGELAFVEYLKNNTDYPGVNSNVAQQIFDMDSLPFPDYSDFDLSQYSATWWQPEKEPTGCSWLYITGTRGCVKRCTFCNVGTIWPQFLSKSGKTIAEELQYYVDTTGVSKYYFTDSLLNGNIDVLEEMADGIIAAGLKIQIKGQWIARGEKLISPELWHKLKKAGLSQIIIGIESGSAKLRNDMKKGVREQDIEYTFAQASLNNIKCIPLMMVGYPTETEVEFQENLDFLERYKQYAHDGTIMMMGLGHTTSILPGTPLDLKFKDMGLYYDDLGNWVYNDNTMKVRIERWFRMRDRARDLNYSLVLDTPGSLIREYKKITGVDLTEEYKLRKGEQIWT
jgi:radical SAM superfamily enzyme YgiQ (UPF0313 family)